MRISKSGKHVLLASLSFFIFGCQQEEFPVVVVSGLVTLDGEPVPNALVGFEPVAKPGSGKMGPGSFARTNDQGIFELVSIDKRKGAVVGKHRVRISTFEAETGPNGETIVLFKETLPARYHNRSALSFDVPPEGTDQANFELTRS